jgi:membrane fusion protein (multidrug efflux system)
MAAGIVILITDNWNRCVGDRTLQSTGSAYVRADPTPVGTRVAGLVPAVAVFDYQPVRAADLLVQLRVDDFRAQVQQAESVARSGKETVVNNHRQKELRAGEGIRSGDGDIATAQAGNYAAKSAITNALRGIDASKADVERTRVERRRQGALFATEAATRQRVEEVIADEERFRVQLATRQDDLNAATAQFASRHAELARARAHLGTTESELEAQKRQRAVLDSQDPLLHADLDSKKAALELARTNLGYTRIIALESRLVGGRKVRPGQLVSPGTQVISLVQRDVWVHANYKETYVRHIHPDDPATIVVDAFPACVLKERSIRSRSPVARNSRYCRRQCDR